ncbi:MAG: methionyl-tRNA formyltransferase [bacterium]
MTKLYFFGTPHFAQIVLRQLIEAEKGAANFKLAGVFTKKGSLVANLAGTHNLICFTPQNKAELVAKVQRSTSKDSIFIVAAYGIIFPKELLEYPKLGCFNIHGSLLAKYRGASPIQRALLDGRKKTGVTIILMDEGVDTGKVAARAEVLIDAHDTYPTLGAKMAHQGAKLVLDELLSLLPQLPPLTEQKGTPSLAPQIKKEDGFVLAEELINNPRQTINKLRALTPWPGVYTTVAELVKAYSSVATPPLPPLTPLPPSHEKIAKVLAAKLDLGGKLAISRLQLEGKTPISWKEFENGYLKG